MPVSVPTLSEVRSVTFRGNPVTVVGRTINEGDIAPPYTLVNVGDGEVNEQEHAGLIKVITTFPSVDTSVCSIQVQEFNNRIARTNSETVVIGISKDLPYALKRFATKNNLSGIELLSDYRYSSFGLGYGLLIQELNLLARSAVIVDKSNVIRYLQIAPEASTQHLDYDEVIDTLGQVASSPYTGTRGKEVLRCVPCEGNVPPLTGEQLEERARSVPEWAMIDNRKLKREISCQSFKEALFLLNTIATIAEEQGHHPVMTINYSRLAVVLTTYAAGGLTHNDFIMAKLINDLLKPAG